MSFNVFFGKIILGNISKLYSSCYVRGVCRECKPFIKSSSKILDLGCGRGETTCGLREYFKSEVIGADIQDVRTKNFPFQIINEKDLPFEDSSFDVIFIRYVLHHTQDPISILKEAKRVSRGKIIIYEDLPEGVFSKIFCEIHGLTFGLFLQPKFKKLNFKKSSEWKKIFAQLGLKIVFEKKFFSFLETCLFYPVQKIFFVLEKQ